MAFGVACILSFLVAGCFAEEVFTPTLGMKQLDGLESALHKIVDNPRLTAAQMKSAQKVVADVEGAVAEMSRKDLPQAEKAMKFHAAINELSSLQSEWAREAKMQSNTTAIQERMDALQKELSEKKKALEQMEDMLKLVKLKKQLAEKQWELEGLKQAKSHAQANEEAKQDAASKEAMVKNLLAMAKGLAAAKPNKKTEGAKGKDEAAGVPAALKPILADLAGRAHKVSEAINLIDTVEKKREAELNGAETNELGVKLDHDAKKRKAMIKMILGQSRRAYKKNRAMKEAELGELNEAVRSVETGDATSLRKVMAKMEGETKAQAKGSKFLV